MESIAIASPVPYTVNILEAQLLLQKQGSKLLATAPSCRVYVASTKKFMQIQVPTYNEQTAEHKENSL
jgi:hypothetical protein